ncbi:MAG: LssY C-terminal domain-containing protein [bacterium]
MKKFLRSLKKSFGEALSNNEYVIRLVRKYPTFFTFIKNRLSFAKPFGFLFTAGIIASAYFFIYFLSITQDVLIKDQFVEADVRIMNLIAAFRNIKVAQILLLFTYLGNWQIIVSLGFIILIILWLLGKKRMAMFFTYGVVSGFLAFALFKLLLHRTRPNIGFSLIPQNGYSFPSGHAVLSVIFYGMIGYGIIKISKKRWQKFLVITLAFLLIFLIGFSRLYLGVHWTSDVVAGWSIGFSILVLLITFFKQQERFFPAAKQKIGASKRSIILIATLLFIFEGNFFYYFYNNNPLQIQKTPQKLKEIVIPPSADLPVIILSNAFPKFSETIVGQKMEPVSLIIVGSKEKLIQVFQKAGWFIADKPQPKAIYRLSIAALFNQPYPGAPVTPSFLNDQPEAIAFEKPTSTNTARQRHHTRFWLTNFSWGETPIWIATASFDDGLRYFITHKIHPDIDTERDFIKDDLLKTGLIKDNQQIQLVKSLLGKNQGSDQFFTDGKAYIIFLK